MIVALLLLVAMPMMAERVTPETARKAATTFLNNNGAKTAQLTDLSKAAGFSNLYIFNGEQGFVVMAADDCVQPVLGYSLSGTFVAEDMPDNVRGWLQGYNDEIQYAIDSKMSATAETSKMWRDLTEGNSKAGKATIVVNPLIQTKWSQNKYYNALCPEISGGPEGHAYTGCVATAMAQIMKYWGYPSHGIGSHSYTWNGQTLSADFGNTTYDWNNMANYYQLYYVNGTDQYGTSVSNTQEQITAVATLMYHCGVAVNMDYGAGGSSASSTNIVNAIKTYFNYSSTVEYKEKANYEDAAWIQMVKNELEARRPVEYSGRSGTGNNTSGHSFICDGYDNADYFHFNWGWWGHYDGYFSLNNLNTGANSSQPGAGNGNYTYVQSAIFGIEPVHCTASDPTNLTYSLTGLQGVTLHWTAANGAASYNIYRNGNYVGNSTTNSYSEAAPFGDNEYYVRSVDANGNLSLSSNTVSLYVGYQTPIVNDLTGTLSENAVTLSWSAPDWCYPETSSETLNYGTGTVHYSWSYAYYAHRHLATNLAQYAGKAVYKVSTFIKYPGTYSLYIYTKSTQYNRPDPNSLACNITGVNVTITNGWFEFDTEGPIVLTGTDDLWVVIKQENTGQSNPTPSFNLTEHNTNAFYASSSSPTNLYDGNSSYNCAWLINTYLTDGTYTYNLYQDGRRIASELGQVSYNASLNNNAANVFTVKTNYYGGETEASNMIGFAKGAAYLGSLSLNDNDQMTVTEGSTLTVRGAVTNGVAANLVIEDGAQLVNSSDGVLATVQKTVAAYTQNGGWNLIASPIADDITPSSDNGLLTNKYDLYTFDQSEALEWRNYEAGAFSTIENKTGYLYANNGSQTTISFAGTLANTATATTLDYDGNARFAGFNLIGNPYPCNAYVNRTFYVLNSDGSDFIEGSNPIAPCSAILVQARNAEDNSVTFSKTASNKKNSIVARLTTMDAKGSKVIDQARVCFDEADQLTKFSMGQGSAQLYIPQGHHNYAVACANGQNEMPLNFKATKNGTYALDFEVENMEADYLHLIDNMTGADVDLLATPSYTFEATTDDYEARFRLVFNCEDANDDNDHFAYYADGEIRLVEPCQGASIQVVDMTGRIVFVGDAINRVSTSGMTAGVYVIRLINGEQVKIQKIVVY